jgi:mono/diheme cytochrome c family protein
MEMKIGFGLDAIMLVAPTPAWRPASAVEAAPIMVAQSEQADAGEVATGKALYAHNCSHCHGFNMVNPGTVAYDLRQFPNDDKARFVHSVAEGKNGRMPPWGDLLSREDIDDLWAYVKTGGKE